jgi:predicted phosphodiesterase
MSGLAKKIDAALANQGSDVRVDYPSEAWRPRLEIDDATGGYLVTKPRNAVEQPDAEEILAEFELDPTAWKVTHLRRSRWQAANGEWLQSYRASLVPVGPFGPDTDIDALIKSVEKWKPSKVAPATGDAAYIFNVGDTQYGKDAGGGSDAIVQRVLAGYDAGVTRLAELRKIGRNIGTIVLPQLGDCIEGSSSQNGRLLTRSDLGVTAQVRLARRMLMAQIKAFAPLADRIIIPVVPGNHDEPHRISATDPIDSWQIDIVAAVQETCAEIPALAHVEFRYPERDDHTLAIDVCGTIIGFAHGHQSRDAAKWWQGQATGRTPVGDADVLITGHFHHFKAQQVGPRLWIQVPASDGGSPWFRDKTGLESPTGFVSLVVGKDMDPRLDLAVLSGTTR